MKRAHALAAVLIIVAALARAPLGFADDDDAGEAPITAPARVTIVDGEPVIALDAATQARNGIVTARPQAARALRAIRATAVVLDTSALALARRRYRAAHGAAPALLPAIERSIAARFGPALAAALAHSAPALAAVFAGSAALLEVVPPHGGRPPAALTARGRVGGSWRLARVGPGVQPGGWLYRARGRAALAPGERLRVSLPTAGARVGVWVPRSAVVWWNGAPWVYRRLTGGRFTRQRLAGAVPRRAGGYWTTALTPRDEIVVQGAELLLSEEFRAQIHTEG